MMTEDNDILDRSTDLDGRIARSSEIEALVKASQRSQRSIQLLAISLVFDILLSIVLGVVAIRAQQTADVANSARAHAYQVCLTSNASRTGTIQLWTYILNLTPTVPRTADQQAQVDSLLSYIKTLYAPQTCTPP